MTCGFVIEQNATSVLKGDGDNFARELLSVWVTFNGHLSPNFIPYFDKLIMLDRCFSASPSPEILYCGEDALASRIMGSDWADEPPSAACAFEIGYRRLVGAHYHKAQEVNQPIFDLIGTPVRLNGELKYLRYERLIMPITTPAEAMFLLCYSFAPIRYLAEVGLEPTAECLGYRRPQNKHLEDLFASAALST